MPHESTYPLVAQGFDRQLQQAQLGLRVRQVRGLDLSLCLEHLRQVRVAVDRDAVRPHADDRLQRTRESLGGLLRQTVDQVDIDGFEARGAASVDHRARLLDALDAIDRGLYHRIEILHAEARAVEPDRGELGDVRRIDEARVEFDGDVAIARAGEMELAPQRFHHFAQLGGVRKFGVPPPKCSWMTSRSRSNSCEVSAIRGTGVPGSLPNASCRG